MILYAYLPVLALFSLIGISSPAQTTPADSSLNTSHVATVEQLIGLSFTQAERDSMLPNLQNHLQYYQQLRAHPFANSTAPAMLFHPLPQDFTPKASQETIRWKIPETVTRPQSDADLAFYPVHKLAALIRSGQLTSVELTRLYLQRLKQYGDTLQAVITLTEDLALQQARRADEEMAAGNYRGPLHGIPYGVKDLFAVNGYPTTWGAMPYKNQQLATTATVVNKLEEAGAVLVAKLTLGALAMGDVWYGGVTKNPWDLEQGSSGSSAGSAAATAAGLVGFAIGTETYGSIVSPSTRCGVTGLRPTFGRVSRAGAMALSWSMDKAGPICRSAYDCAMVLDAIRGADPLDATTRNAAFNYQPEQPVSALKVAYINDFFEADYRSHRNDSITLARMRELNVQLQPVSFPSGFPVEAMIVILEAEAAAAFDALTRNNKDDELVAQHRYAWPNLFRYSRTIPAVEYIQANRLRSLLIEQMHQWMQQYDVVLTPSYGGNQLLTTNLTGHPCVVLPNGFDEDGRPTSISMLGNLYDEAAPLRLAHWLQENTEWENKHPQWLK